MKSTLLLASLLISSTSFAQQFKVQKIKDNKAVIEFSGHLVPGRTYSVGSSGSSQNMGSGSRQYIVAGSFLFRSGTDTSSFSVGSSSSTTSTSASDLNLILRFGWNKEQYEFGPILTYRNVNSDYENKFYSSVGGGAFADYNFTPNRVGENTIFAVTGEGTYTTYTPKSSSGGNIMGFFLGGSLKWIGLTSSTGLRADLGYDYQKLTSGNTNVTAAGFVLRAGITTYF